MDRSIVSGFKPGTASLSSWFPRRAGSKAPPQEVAPQEVPAAGPPIALPPSNPPPTAINLPPYFLAAATVTGVAVAVGAAWAYRRHRHRRNLPAVPVDAQPDLLDKYPFIFNIDNISDLFPPVGGQGPVSGWSVTFRDDMRPTLLPGARQRGAAVLKGHIVAIMGLRNVGKTWFVNKMCDTALPSGTVEATPGIGFVLPLRPSMKKQVPLIFMDSPGTNAPVRTLSSDLKASQREISNRMVSNQVISEIMIRNGEHVVVVVQHISHQDQLLIHRLLQYRDQRNETLRSSKEQGSSETHELGPIVVLHNLMNAKTVAEGRAQFEKVADLYSEVETLFFEPTYRHFHFNTQRHIYLINDESREGAAFNEAQIAQIQHWLTATPGQSTFSNIVHNVCQVVNEVLPSYIVAGSQDVATPVPVVYPEGLVCPRPAAKGAEAAPAQQANAAPVIQPIDAEPGFSKLQLTLRGVNSDTWEELPNVNMQLIELGNEFTRFDSLRPYVVQRNQFTPPYDVLVLENAGLQVRIEIAGCDIQRLPELTREAPIESEGWRVVWGTHFNELIVRGVRAEPAEYGRNKPALALGFGQLDKIRYKNWEVRCKLPSNVERPTINKEQSAHGMLVFDLPFRQ
eukprot:TRINITY_DN411_c0_g1_i1.p1 TRINITY_DN411_c0_g1~~TRINITY_DN411_c0_g1_i1.p1  ORF type:complete len:636 (-),score=132.76 TRINITY_DN411_c0_g1_i1:30-1904(-)